MAGFLGLARIPLRLLVEEKKEGPGADQEVRGDLPLAG
jgi:hypothetical protein